MKSQKLFCIPYAGGGADTTYIPWKKYLDFDITLVPVEYPGHGKRIAEPLSKNVEELVTDLYDTIIKPELNKCDDYMIYGHSMGTLVIYELLKIIQQNYAMLPHTIFLSGRYSPNINYEKENVHLLSDDQLINNLIKLGGITPEIYNYPEIIDACLPIIRNDYKIIDEYNFSLPLSCFDSNITYIYSDNDPYLSDREKVGDWQQFTNKKFSIIEVKGDHFFINTEKEFLCQLINKSAKGI